MFKNWIIDMCNVSGFRPKNYDMNLFGNRLTWTVFLRCKTTSLKTFDRYFGFDR